MSLAKQEFDGLRRKIAPSVVLYQDFEKFLKYMPAFDPRVIVGMQETIRIFPDKSTVKVTYSPTSAWDDIRFTTRQHMLYFENQRTKTSLSGVERESFNFLRLTVERLNKKNPAIFKLDASMPESAVRILDKMARDGVNAALSEKDLDKLAERLLREGPDIIANFKANPTPSP
ncbi:MAG: hypothetical protein H6862_07605 [Rhodospirillales bacterium]|nr:hypothetical protein [Rhodospirillales bacterium]